MKKANNAAPTKGQQQHANKITHRAANGKFKQPAHKAEPSLVSSPNGTGNAGGPSDKER